MARVRNNPEWEATRQTANAAALAVVSFLILFVFGAEIPTVRGYGPCADNPSKSGLLRGNAGSPGQHAASQFSTRASVSLSGFVLWSL